MDPLSISASAAALITICVQTVQIIKKTIETVKTVKRELLNVLNETNRMRLLLEQLRGLTHQLGSKNNKILLAFDKTGCEEILGELKRLIDKLAQAELFVGFQFLIRRSKFEALVAGLRAQEDAIRTVLLSVATLATPASKSWILC
jgi:Fungal N-terminal domain of STAND proteins